MAKKQPTSLEALVAVREAVPEQSGVLAMPKPEPNYDKQTVYLPRAAIRRIKQMALDSDRRVNDFLREGVDLMLAKYGQPSIRDFEER